MIAEVTHNSEDQNCCAGHWVTHGLVIKSMHCNLIMVKMVMITIVIASVPSNQGQSTLRSIMMANGDSEDQNCCSKHWALGRGGDCKCAKCPAVIASVPSNQRSQGQLNFEDKIRGSSILRSIMMTMVKIKIVPVSTGHWALSSGHWAG